MNPYKKMAELYIIQYCKLSLVTWFCRHCSKEKTLKNLERVSAMCCCTISRPIRKQISAMRLRVFRHTAERVCTPQGKLNTEGEKVRGQLRLLLFFYLFFKLPSFNFLTMTDGLYVSFYPILVDVNKSSRGSRTSWLIFISISIRVVSDRNTIIFWVSTTAPKSPASFRVFKRQEEGGDTCKFQGSKILSKTL